MITKNIYNKVLGLALAALTFTACTETWDEHYEGLGGGGIHEGTLWQAIKSNPDLSNFATVIEGCDFAKSLDGSQVFTVFAPTNANFSKEEAEALVAEFNKQKSERVVEDDNTVLKEFIQNHIALYNYSVAKDSRDSIMLMNGKYAVLSSNDIDGVQMITKNQLYGNGVLYTLRDKVSFLSNVFEYVAKDPDLDSLHSFLYNTKYYYREFMPERSVPGSIVDGKTQYLDSVFMQRNDLFSYLGQLNIEDSTYLMVAPTNEVWKSLIEEYEPYFNYPANPTKRDSMAYTHPRLAIINGTTFSRTFNPDKILNDSALSESCVKEYSMRENRWGGPYHYYQYMKPLVAPYGVLNESTSEVIKCSNGNVYKTSQWNIDKLMTFHKYLIIQGENSGNIKEVSRKPNSQGDSIPTVQNQLVRVDAQNAFYDKVWNKSFMEFAATTATVNYSVTYYLRDVLSNIGYDIYLVTAPVLAADSNAAPEARVPALFKCTVKAPGKEDEDLINPNPVTKKNTDFITSADSISYILLAEDYKFDVCTYGVNDESLQTTMTIETTANNAQVRNKQYTRTIYLDCILLVPHGTLEVVDELPEGPYAGTPGVMLYPHGAYNDRYFDWWYMRR